MKRDIEALKIIYEEVCRAHDGIADFRAKLLAFLPFASGTGIFLLLDDPSSKTSEHLLAIGLFGFSVTIGLFVYEMRGVQRCNSLSNCGRNLENEILGKNNFTGTFVGEPNAAFLLIGNTWASILTYSTVISAWVYVALTGWGYGYDLVTSAVFWVSFVAIGDQIRRRQDAILHTKITEAKASKDA